MLDFGLAAEVDPGPFPALRDRLEKPRGLLGELAHAVADYERDVFATGDGGEWAANDPMTVALKGSSRPLIDSGELFRELTSPASARIVGDAVELSTSHVGAVMAKRGARGVPVRDAVPAPDANQVDEWTERFLDVLVGGL